MVSLTMNVTQLRRLSVYLIDHSTNEIVLRASQLPHDAEIGNVRMKMAKGITGWVAPTTRSSHCLKNAHPMRVSKRSARCRKIPTSVSFGCPLSTVAKSSVSLTCITGTRTSTRVTKWRWFTFIGEQMGGVIARARSPSKRRARCAAWKTLAAVAQAISAESYLERILQAISEMLAETLDSAVCSILLVDDEKKELTVSAARCSAPDYMHRMPIRMEGSLIEYVIRQGHPIVIPNIHNEKAYRYPELARKSGLASLLAAPLTSQGKVIGSINIYTRDERAFSDDEIGFVKVVAGQAAIAIQNARLMSETLDMKRTLEARKLIERAKGILQYKHHLTEEEAYLRLRNESRRLRRSMRDLAEAVILADDLNKKDGTAKVAAVREDSEIM